MQFRRWASTVLKEHLLKGFVMDDERLKNPDGRPDYFDEMSARIRDIRASERRLLAPERGPDHQQQPLLGANPCERSEPRANGKQHQRAISGL